MILQSLGILLGHSKQLDSFWNFPSSREQLKQKDVLFPLCVKWFVFKETAKNTKNKQTKWTYLLVLDSAHTYELHMKEKKENKGVVETRNRLSLKQCLTSSARRN